MGWLDATACLSTIWERSGQPEKRWRGKKASVWRALLTASTWSNWKTDRFFTVNLVWMLNIAHCISVLFWIYSMSESLESAETALFTRLLLLALFTAAAFGHSPLLLLLPSDRRSLWPSARCHTIKSEVGRLVQRLMPWLGRLMNGMTRCPTIKTFHLKTYFNLPGSQSQLLSLRKLKPFLQCLFKNIL